MSLAWPGVGGPAGLASGCQAVHVSIPATPPRDFGPLFEVERARLLDLVGALGPADWAKPSPCPGWSVLGLAAHLLGDDFGLLAAQRDGHLGTPAPAGLSGQEFIRWLDEMQVEWVHAARRLSPRLVTDLLGWTGSQVVDLVRSQDPSAVTATVSWAHSEPVPVWLDQARELSERWIHRQQILQAVDRPSDLRPDLAEPVLDGLRWAYPFRLRPHRRPAGSTVCITVTGPEVRARWTLVSDSSSWQFRPDTGRPIVAELRMTDEQAWRLLSNNFRETLDGDLEMSGEPDIVETLRRTRAIIGTPK
jgi:uncharacterized protein (TIGR03083 family)